MILIVISRFNESVTKELESSAVKTLEEAKAKYKIIQVPGAVEIPLTIQHFLKTGAYAAAIALGCVIKGQTDHYEFVLRSCIDGLTQVGLNENTPVIQGIIAAPTRTLAWERKDLGKNYAQTALEMIKILSKNEEK